jgi:hypothetical protein
LTKLLFHKILTTYHKYVTKIKNVNIFIQNWNLIFIDTFCIVQFIILSIPFEKNYSIEVTHSVHHYFFFNIVFQQNNISVWMFEHIFLSQIIVTVCVSTGGQSTCVLMCFCMGKHMCLTFSILQKTQCFTPCYQL